MLGHSRHIVARFGLHQDLQTLLRCHMAAFAAIGGVPIEILYDRMKTAVTGEDYHGRARPAPWLFPGRSPDKPINVQDRIGFNNRILRHIKSLRYIRQLNDPPS